jgi:peptidoglycan/LPS O-acetylase OafA/YrhL
MSHSGVAAFDVIPGPSAVQAFFVISGFYMALILNRKYNRSSVAVFYTNRLLRLFPTYWLVLLISLGVLYILDIGTSTRIHKFQNALSLNALTGATCVLTNIAIVGQELLFLFGVDKETYTLYWVLDGTAFAKAWHFSLVTQAWSLSMELYFYLLAPFILTRGLVRVVLLFSLSVGLRLFFVAKGHEYDLFVRRFLPTELWLFLAVALSYFVFEKIREYKKNIWLGSLCWVALVVVLVFFDYIPERYSLGLLACAVFASIPFIFNLTKDNKVDRFLGNIAYPVYLVHFLIITVLEEYVGEYSLILLLPLLFAAALILYYGIEAPIDRWRQRRVSAPSPQSLPPLQLEQAPA